MMVFIYSSDESNPPQHPYHETLTTVSVVAGASYVDYSFPFPAFPMIKPSSLP